MRINNTVRMMSTATAPTKKYNVAIIGGGITGASAAHTISQQNNNINIHLFDQGRRGVGGRSSHRQGIVDGTHTQMRWDHGCQFFRADTDRFSLLVKDWISKDLVKEWKGDFRSSTSCKFDFFGMPSQPPFYVGADGMQNVSKGVLDQIMQVQLQEQNVDSPSSKLSLFAGTRVAQLERDETSKKWKLLGTQGEAAYHDTAEKVVQQSNENITLGEVEGYDGIILTDVSSSFGNWHRASAGVPESFAAKVRERVGARVPLFTVMLAFEKDSAIPFDAATFDNDLIWFASKTNSKPGMDSDMKECWTLVSTPEYAMEKIAETPMQDPKTGEFIPQSEEYLMTVPGPDLKGAFCKEIMSKDGILGNNALSSVPNIIHIDAQRWGSAMPCHRHLDEFSKTRKVLSGVPYDSGRSPLAPTTLENCRHGDERTFLVNEDLMLFQAGDMMSTFTPGFEGAAISGMDAAEYLLEKLSCSST